MFTPTRAAGLDRLTAFLPRSGRDDTALRNRDRPDHPSFSDPLPWLCHRLVTEAEVIDAADPSHPATCPRHNPEVRSAKP